MIRAGLIAGLALMPAAVHAEDRGAAYQFIERRCERLIQATPDDIATLSRLRLTLPAMCECIASTMTARLLPSETETLSSSETFPPHVEALWTASRGFCALTLSQKQTVPAAPPR